jgi:hypothetical protein
MDLAFLFLMLAVFLGFNCRCLLSALISSKARPKISFWVQIWLQSKPCSFSAVKFGNFSAIILIVVVLFKIVTPHVGSLRIPRRLAYTTGNRLLIFYWQ